MSSTLLTLSGIIVIGMAVMGLITGKVIAGSRGLRSNYHTRRDSPFSYYAFVCIYLLIGALILFNSIEFNSIEI